MAGAAAPSARSAAPRVCLVGARLRPRIGVAGPRRWPSSRLPLRCILSAIQGTRRNPSWLLFLAGGGARPQRRLLDVPPPAPQGRSDGASRRVLQRWRWPPPPALAHHSAWAAAVVVGSRGVAPRRPTSGRPHGFPHLSVCHLHGGNTDFSLHLLFSPFLLTNLFVCVQYEVTCSVRLDFRAGRYVCYRSEHMTMLVLFEAVGFPIVVCIPVTCSDDYSSFFFYVSF